MPVLDELEELLAGAETELSPLKADFSGSLAFIDRLATKRPLAIKSGITTLGRDADVISNALFWGELSENEALPRAPRLAVDNRRFAFERTNFFDPGELTAGAGQLVDEDIVVRPRDPWKWEEKFIEKLKRGGRPVFTPRPEHMPLRQKFADGVRMAICLKRKMRREMMHVIGEAGVWHRPRHFTPFSRVRCD